MNKMLAFALISLGLVGGVAHSQSGLPVALLFQQLKEATTTDKAKTELIALANSDPSARTYLADHLPAFIEKGPSEPEEPWSNAIDLATSLRMVEAAPALGKWITLSSGGTTGMTAEMRLDNYPPARALIAIGDPAIPTLVAILDQGNRNERSIAIRVLRGIHSTNAKGVLEMQHERDPDSGLRDFIEKVLAGWKPGQR